MLDQAYSAAADVYSFGLILWELLTWQLPWAELGPFQVSLFLLTTTALATKVVLQVYYLTKQYSRSQHAALFLVDSSLLHCL